jgi:hypothetical protein
MAGYSIALCRILLRNRQRGQSHSLSPTFLDLQNS